MYDQKYKNQSKLAKSKNYWHLLLHKVWPLLPKVIFWRKDWTLACFFTRFWNFVFISWFLQILRYKSRGHSWGKSYIKFILPDIKFRFTWSRLDLHRTTVNVKNIMPQTSLKTIHLYLTLLTMIKEGSRNNPVWP